MEGKIIPNPINEEDNKENSWEKIAGNIPAAYECSRNEEGLQKQNIGNKGTLVHSGKQIEMSTEQEDDQLSTNISKRKHGSII